MTFERVLRAANVARQGEWDSAGVIDFSWRQNELAGEVGEVCNVIKKLHRERTGLAGSRATIGQLAEELADVIICVDLCGITANAAPVAWAYDKYVKMNLVEAGSHLAVTCGWACELSGDSPHVTSRYLGHVVSAACRIGAQEGVDMISAVISKFNATSEKVGLKTRIRY